MGAADTGPSAFAVTRGEGSSRVSLSDGAAPPTFAWARVSTLDLDVAPASSSAPTAARVADPAAAAGEPFERIKTRRLGFLRATIETDAARLQAALDRCPLAAHGFRDVRVWLGTDAPGMEGRVTIGHREAPFTIQVGIEPRAEARRRLRISFSDVRLFGPLPLPAPLVGAALARAIVAGCGGDRPELRAAAGAVILAPLDLALIPTLVARGWRLPDLAPAWLESVERHAGDLRLSFGSERRPTEKMAPLEPASEETIVSFLEGARLADSLGDAERKLFSGDLMAAEAAFQQALRAHADERGARCRLTALHVAMGTPEAAADARELTARWPDLIPGWLFAAITSSERGDWHMAAALFERAARLADGRGETEDARLADEAAAAAASRARSQLAAERAGGSPTDGPGTHRGTAAATPLDQAVDEAPVAEDGAVHEIARALAANDRATADALIAKLLGPSGDAATRAALFADIAEAQLTEPSAGDAVALATLGEVSLANSTERALALRADLGERLGDLPAARGALGEIVTRAVAAGDMELARSTADRQSRLGKPVAPAPAGSPDEVSPVEPPPGATPEAGAPTAGAEAVATADPAAAALAEGLVDAGAESDVDVAADVDVEIEVEIDDGPIPTHRPTSDSGDVTGKVEALYAAESDPQTRAGALDDLLRSFDQLPPERQRAAFTSFGRVAESTGDLEHAEEAYLRGTRLEGQPREKADFLLAHARLLQVRGKDQAALAELQEAVDLAPDHGGVRAALADHAYRAHAFVEARAHYAELDRLGVAAEILPRETLLHRRAILARAAGDTAEAEAFFHELASLDPRHIEARQALGDIAADRGDLVTAAQRLEEVVRLLPIDALEALLDVRQRLGDLHVGLQDWAAARHYLELILAQDPTRVAALERLAEAYENLGLFEESAGVWGRLSRFQVQPARRAEALFRQGEILLEWLGDAGRAFDSYLKSSDLDPTFVPTALRLIAGFWRRAQYDDVADVAAEIDATGALAGQPLSVRLRVAMATAFAGRDTARVAARVAPSDLAEDPDVAAMVLAEAATHRPAAPPHELEPAVALLASVGGVAAPGGGVLDIAERTLEATVLADPSAVGAARALGWLADRREEVGRARALYALATFLDETDGTAGRLAELGPAEPAAAAALALGGPCDHPDAGGPAAAPLRRALGALADGLAGFGALGAATPSPPGGPSITTGLRESLAALGRIMGAPALTFQVSTPARTSEEPAEAAHAGDVVALATRPGTIRIAPQLLDGNEDELFFLVARAIDRVRSGRALVDGATSGTAEDVAALLQGANAALTGSAPPEEGLGAEVAAAMGEPDRAAAVVRYTATGSAALDDLQAGQDALSSWDPFREAAARASDRFGLLACRSPVGALRALHAVHDPGAAGGELSDRERRVELLGTSDARELVAFMLGPAYAHATRAGVG